MPPKTRAPYKKPVAVAVAVAVVNANTAPSNGGDYSADMYSQSSSKVAKKGRKADERKNGIIYNKSAEYLIIVESPSKCKKIEDYLGEKYACISSKGHIRIIENLKSIEPNGNIRFTIDAEKAAHVAEMRKIVARFSKTAIYIATDGDREGEAIGWHICDIFDLPIDTTPRIIFHEITKPAILAAIRQPSIINMNLVFAQHARQILDMFVGFHISPVLWKFLYYNRENALSAGRCQTPALRLILENKCKPRETKLVDKVKGYFFARNIEFVLDKVFYNKDTHCPSAESIGDFLSESITYNHLLSTGPPKVATKSPPKPFHTSRLLQSASNILGLSPKDAMAKCQLLYQDGYITYMRTDSQEYSTIFIEEAHHYIREKYGEKYCGIVTEMNPPHPIKTEAHEAIRPTNIDIDNIENHTASALYRLIWKNTVESLMPPAKYKTVEVKISAPMNAHYIHTIEIPIFVGWKKVAQNLLSESGNLNATFHMEVTSCRPNSRISYNYIATESSEKGHVPHYTEANLIQKLEELGIGRPSTYANIIQTLKERGYVKTEDVEGTEYEVINYILQSDGQITSKMAAQKFGNEKNKLILQPIGQIVCEFLNRHFTDFFEYNYTRKMEESLDSIANNSDTHNHWFAICEGVLSKVLQHINNFDPSNKLQIPLTDTDKYVIVYGKYGPVIRSVVRDNNAKYEYITIKRNLNIDFASDSPKYSLEELLHVKPDPDAETSKNPNILRSINNHLSIRKGKTGPYLFYKTEKMKKPEFYSLPKSKIDTIHCLDGELIDWVRKMYNIPI